MLYIYDGTFDGLMSAIFEIFDTKDRDAAIVPASRGIELSLFGSKAVETSDTASARVQKGLEKLSPELPAALYKAMLSGEDGVEDLILAAVRLGFAEKTDPLALRSHDFICRLSSVIRKVGWEGERMREFVRFRHIAENCWAADIEPQYDVLPLIGDHFHDRFGDSLLIIRNLKHLTAIISQPSGWYITTLPENNPPLPDEGEYERLWRGYFVSIANKQRENLKLQQKFIPLRYRKYLTEFQ